MTIGRRSGTLKGFAVAVGVLVAIGWAVGARAQQVVSCRTLGTQPVSRSFDDVTSPPALVTAVTVVVNGGIMTECGGSFFCPNDLVTRADLAIAAENAAHMGALFQLAAPTGRFTDVPKGFALACWVEQAFSDGMIGACPAIPGQFCPDAAITRADMAIAIVKARHGASYTPPACAGMFPADPLPCSAYNEEASRLGVPGCGTPGSFCPSATVARADLATALYNVFIATPRYAISGNAGAAGVTVALSGVGSVLSVAGGGYRFEGVSAGTYTVTPSKNGCTFTPGSASVTVGPDATQNFTANCSATYSISGNVGTGSADVTATLVATGAASTVKSDPTGAYSFTSLAPGTYTVSVQKTGCTFTPTSLSVTIGPSATGQNFTASCAATTYSISGNVGVGGALVTAGTASTTADAAGNYTITGLANGTYTVTPSKANYSFNPTSRSVTISGANVTGINFTASAVTFSISGNTGATFGTVTASGTAGTVSATCDSTGAYTIAGLGAGTYTVTPSKTNCTFTPTALTVTVGPSATGQNFTPSCTPGVYTIAGRVTSGGLGLAGVDIRGPLGLYATTTDANGYYSVTATMGGVNPLTMTPTLYGCTFVPSSRSYDFSVSPHDYLNEDYTATCPTYTVSGTVTVKGAALTGVNVTVGTQTVVTDAAGSYTTSGLRAGTYTATPVKTGYEFTPPNTTVAVSTANVTGVNFAVTTYTISGTVKLNGTGLGGATVNVGGQTAITNGTGQYSVSGFLNGTYQVTPSMGAYAFSPATKSVVISAASVNAVDFDVVTYAISGQVTLNGVGVSGITVSAGTWSATTGPTGTFSIAGVPNGSYTVTPSFGAYKFSPASAAVTVAGVDITQVNFGVVTHTISGTVTLNTSGISGISVSAGGFSATTDLVGKYTISGAPDGIYAVTPSSGVYTFNPQSLSVTVNGADVAGQDFSVVTYSIAGAITSGGNPLVGVRVTAGAREGLTDASGNYTIAGLTNNTYSVTPSLAGYTFTPANRSIAVSGANVAGVTFTGALITYSISGTVTLNSVGLAGATVSTGTTSATTDANGKYTISGLVNGTYTVTPSKPGSTYTFTPPSAAVAISGADVGKVDFAVVTYSISGRITLGTAGLGGVTVTAGTRTGTTDASGNYTVTGLTNATYTVTPALAAYVFSPASQSIIVNSASVGAINFAATPTYSISGNAGVGGATVSAGTASTTADPTGAYTITGLVAGAYTVTPSKAGYTFTPANQSVTITSANVTAINFTAAPVTLSGTVTLNGAGLSGVSVTAGTLSATTDLSGNYTISPVPNGSYTVTPSKAGYIFSPAGASVTVSGANVAGVNFAAFSAIGAPTLLSPANLANPVSRLAALSWSSVTGALSYDLQIAGDAGFASLVQSASGLTATAWTISPALAGSTTFYWRVRTVNAAGAGVWSAAWSFATFAPLPCGTCP